MENPGPTYDGEDGRWCAGLMDLAREAKNFSHFFVIVGDIVAKSQSMRYICKKYEEFWDAVHPTKVKFAGHMRRKACLKK